MKRYGNLILASLVATFVVVTFPPLAVPAAFVVGVVLEATFSGPVRAEG